MRLHRSWIMALLCLSGCLYERPMPNPPVAAISIPLDNHSQAEAEAHARQYCAEYAGWALLDMVNYTTIDPFLTYSCN